MPKRKTKFILGGTYHIYSRGVAKSRIFQGSSDYKRFESLLNYYRFNPSTSYSKRNRSSTEVGSYYFHKETVKILSYCCMKNHFHIQLKQESPFGIEIFMKRILNSYSHYFNNRYHRVGPLFQDRFKDVPVSSYAQYIYLSAYIHKNPSEAGLYSSMDSLIKYPYSSLSTYLGNDFKEFVSKDEILSMFSSKDDYVKYVKSLAFGRSRNG